MKKRWREDTGGGTGRKGEKSKVLPEAFNKACGLQRRRSSRKGRGKQAKAELCGMNEIRSRAAKPAKNRKGQSRQRTRPGAVMRSLGKKLGRGARRVCADEGLVTSGRQEPFRSGGHM